MEAFVQIFLEKIIEYFATWRYEKFREKLEKACLKAKAGRGDGFVPLESFPTAIQTVAFIFTALLGIVVVIMLTAAIGDGFNPGTDWPTYLITALYVPLVYFVSKIEARYVLDTKGKKLLHVNSFFAWKKAKQLLLFSDVLMLAIDSVEIDENYYDGWSYHIVVVKKNGQRIQISTKTYFNALLPPIAKLIAKAMGTAVGEGQRKEKLRIMGL